MIKSIRHNLGNLTNFNGRDARQTFWFWVLVVVIVQYAVSMLASVPMIISMSSGMISAITQNPESVDATAQAIDSVLDDMLVWVKFQIIVGSIIGVISIGMLAASFVRRLHDGGFTGWIAVVPIAAYLFSLAYNIVVIDQVEEMMRASMASGADGSAVADPFAMQAEMGVMGLVGWLAPLIGIIFGVWPSEEGPNQYGEEPDLH
ncbi:DUF805 domain-containing protein [uncultured Erythrobacter sp.]|uniref:DUF805 domain-containing protein n=1 Tax=uncultured Erythrobacter sp. TaxID=263913 RepID=UPI00260AEC47|nr:DUF805 domain-containing protein [uncultured Erythrobacter sp.]